MKLFPSLIAQDFANIPSLIKQLEPHCSGFHVDIMDGQFVPNRGWSVENINKIRKLTKKQLWVHLMVLEPENYNQLMLHKQDIVSLHYESFCTTSCHAIQLPPQQKVVDPEYIKGCQESFDALRVILPILRKNGLRTSLALSPLTPIGVIQPLIDLLDQVVIMSVEPGFSGQQFLPQTWGRLDELINLKNIAKAPFTIALDGGITQAILKKLKSYREIEAVALSSAIFQQPDPVKALKEFSKN